jgi:hypothetical protein
MRIPVAMGFLSRKSKFTAPPVEEAHPIVEELEEMEAAVPAMPEAPQPAGPVAAGDPPPPAVA